MAKISKWFEEKFAVINRILKKVSEKKSSAPANSNELRVTEMFHKINPVSSGELIPDQLLRS